jgi:SAM-dependent methyltransferase
MSASKDLFLPDGYVSRPKPNYFDDAGNLSGTIVHQPDVYAFADWLLRVSRRGTALDIGCGSARKLLALGAKRRIGLDYEANIRTCRAHSPAETWIELDLELGDLPDIPDLDPEKTVVVCSDVIEHLIDPAKLLGLLARLYEMGAIVLISTPARTRARGAEHMGPPSNAAHVREWDLPELERLLDAHGLPPTFAGYTLNNTRKRRKNTILTIHDRHVNAAVTAPAAIRPPLALINGEVHGPATAVQIAVLERQGVEIQSVGTEPRVDASILAEAHAGRWVMQLDAGEIPCSPWEGISLRSALGIVEATGAEAVPMSQLEMAVLPASSLKLATLEPFAFAATAQDHTHPRILRASAKDSAGGQPQIFAYAFHCCNYAGAGTMRAARQRVAHIMSWQDVPRYGPGFYADYLAERLSDVAITRDAFLGRL